MIGNDIRDVKALAASAGAGAGPRPTWPTQMNCPRFCDMEKLIPAIQQSLSKIMRD
jgi:hypothetical protein